MNAWMCDIALLHGAIEVGALRALRKIPVLKVMNIIFESEKQEERKWKLLLQPIKGSDFGKITEIKETICLLFSFNRS